MEVVGGSTELEEDIAELKGMLAASKRLNVRRELQRVLDMLEAELARGGGPTAAAANPSTAAAPTASSSATPAPAAPEKAAAPKPKPKEEQPRVSVPVSIKAAGPWSEITTFSQDLGGYDKPHVTVDVRLKGAEALPQENITCDFTENSFDLKVIGLEGQNYRFLRTNLDKDIVAADSSVRVKKNHVIVTLQKVKGQYGYDSWTDLVAKGGRRREPASKSEKPQDSIMSMMKDLYDDGDESMKKVIGEAMYKAQRGEKYEPKADDLSMGGGLGDMM